MAKGENRNLAVKQILDCIIEEKNKLDLSNLGLKSLPNLSPLNFLTKLNWERNDHTVIENCFEIVDGDRYRLKESASLPDAIKEVTMNTESMDRFDGNERLDPRVLSYYDNRIRTVHFIKTPEYFVDGRFVSSPPGRENARFLSLPLLVPLNSYYGWDYLE
ncbi:hypothetical protein [Sodalis glossinidius]|uniref:hypothetical protein n=1 Tax=Sodalis glossinidius TaxID=63612 RepID=UPI0013050C49|nr:hypothetical protein [Sodalis glossinidius]